MLQDKLNQWEAKMTAFTLPDWDSLPELELYMDQVVLLVSRYLNFPSAVQEEDDEDREKLITASIVNNYVRMKVMPAPVKKRYSRVHLAYLLIICTLKQSLSIAFIRRLLPMGLTEREVEAAYTRFVRQYRSAVQLFSQYSQVVLQNTAQSDGLVGMATQAAVVTNLSKSLAEYLLLTEAEKGEGIC